MEPAIPDLRDVPRAEAYARLREIQALLLEGSDDQIAAMATMSALLHHAFGHLWTGFYRVVEPGALLRVGPYQGSLGCLDIAFGRGVCGTAAAERRTVVVAASAKSTGGATTARRTPTAVSTRMANSPLQGCATARVVPSGGDTTSPRSGATG